MTAQKNHMVKDQKNEQLNSKEIEEMLGINLEGKSDEEIDHILIEMQLEQRFSGPLPHPSILKGYEEILPGSADRILTMAENQSKHRQKLESKVVSSNSRDSLLGVIFAFVLGVIGLIGGVYAAISGAEILGTIVSAGSIATLAGVFVYGTNSDRKERQSKK